MSKPLIDEVVENAQHVAPCPACLHTPGLADTSRNQMGQGSNGLHKRGRWKGLARSSMPRCPFCKGVRVVYLNRICTCAMPAVFHDATRKLWFCGSEDCATSILWHRGLHGSTSGAYGPEVDWIGS